KAPQEISLKLFMTDKIVAITTCSSQEEASKIARHLLGLHLAACVQLLPAVQSLYHWQGATEESTETLVFIKSSRPLFDRLRAEIARHHSYSTPEIIALPIVDGAPGYLQWLDHELTGS
ncbi:MAG: divalent-cation tolerance protein CutA, partial [Acidobacteriota bacterium]